MSNGAGTNNQQLRILSMDGGGVYGMFTDLMLKDLHGRGEDFLDKDCVHLFAGTSAGSVNACILALHEHPVEGLEAATRFWAEPGVYDNSDPTKLWFTSLAGLSPYFGTDDYRQVLEKYFGDKTLGDLHHPVLVVTWDWNGLPAKEGAKGDERHWKPRIFCNFPDDNPDRQERVADVAFKAGAPSWFRCIYKGGQDGGLVAPNPALYAVTKVVDTLSKARGAKDASKLPPGFRPLVTQGKRTGDDKHFDLLGHLSVFSLGVGARQPFLPVSYANWSNRQWMSGMWNPYTGHWVSPMTSIALDGPTDAVDKQCDSLLNIPGHPCGFFRLNPRVLETPVMDALMNLRANPWYLEYIEKDIRKAVEKPVATRAIKKAEGWLRSAGWMDRKGGKGNG